MSDGGPVQFWRPPWRVLVLLALALLAVHAWLLDDLPLTPLVQTPDTVTMTTRAIAAPPPPTEPAVAAPKPITKATVKPAPKPPVALPAPVPTPTDAPPALPADLTTVPVAGNDTNTSVAATTTATTSDGTTVSPSWVATASQTSPTAVAAMAAAGKGFGDKPTAHVTVSVPAAMRLEYAVKGIKMTGGPIGHVNYFAKATLLWQHDAQNYTASYEISAFLIGSRSQTSQGRLGSQGLLPDRYGEKNRSEVAAHFQRDKGIVSFSANTPDVPLQEGAQDRLSLFLQLGAMLAALPAAPGSQLGLQVVGPRDADLWTFTVEPGETLTGPDGDMPTVKLARLPSGDYDQKLELWLAPGLGYLPARIRLSQSNGDEIDQQLSGHGAP